MIKITEYKYLYQDAVIALILPIQQEEFGLPILLSDQPDLLKIPTVYQQGNGNFWVALDEDLVIGTIGAIDIGCQQLVIRKMYVEINYRGKEKGTANQLLATLLSWAKEKNIREIYLGTTELFKAAHRFYEKNSFVRIKKSELPANFPVMQVDTRFYRLSLI
ncbi:MAG: GNAT family N-acetyltransferase [Nostocaceae cyanobacterium]|nr:GNAT family N-acetyltransferase [Nostocaceae cyanobacterium]